MPAGTPATGRSVRVALYLPLISATFAAGLLAGCTSEEPIVVERVPKDDIRSVPVAEPVAQTDRMLAAIIPHDESAVFFKLTGPEQAVARLKEDFLELTRSVTFEDGEPNWTLPEGWTEQRSTGERLATIEIPGDPPLTATVTSLPMRGDETEYRLANVNRWRGQMGLPPIAADELHAGGDLDEETVEVTLADGTKATLVNIVGSFQAGGMTPPFAGGGFASGLMSRDAAPAEPGGPSYDVPEGWEDIGREGISAATLLAGDVKTTITPLNAEANPLYPNVVRWRGQVGLPPIEEAQLDEAVQTITLGDGDEGSYVELVGPGDAQPQRAILGVVAYRDDTAWFVKMTGDAEAVLREKSNFETFMKSLRFSEGDN